MGSDSMIFVTIGTSSFLRLVKEMDVIAGKLGENVVMQIGYTNYAPINATFFDFLDMREISRLNQDAELVVCHGGVGSIINALKHGTSVIAVPRINNSKEMVCDNHQAETLEALSNKRLIKVVWDLKDLESSIAYELKSHESKGLMPYESAERENLIKNLKAYLSNISK